MKAVFKVVAGVLTIASSLKLLTRDSSYDQLVAAFSTCVLPAGANLIKITDGCVRLKVQVESLSALEALWNMYKDGALQASLQALFVTEEIRELAGGEQVEAIVTIDEQEYEKTRNELTHEAQENVKDKEEKQPKQYLDQQKYSYIQKYLEETERHSATSTGESDSGVLEEETDEYDDSAPKLYLKDLSEEVTEELTSRLQSDLISQERFFQSFGLDPEKLNNKGLQDIAKFFPSTPVKILKDVFEALKLFDLVDLLQNASKRRSLRPALSLKKIEMLPASASYRPTKDYSKVEVLIINCSNDATIQYDTEQTGSFFQGLSSQSKVTSLTATASGKLLEDLAKLKAKMMVKETDALMAETRETMLKVFLEAKIPDSAYGVTWRPKETVTDKNEQLLGMFQKEESAMKKELTELVEKRKQQTNDRLLMNEEIKQKAEKLKRENEKFEMAVSSAIDNWITQSRDKGVKSTLFVVLLMKGFKLSYIEDDEKFMKMIGECLRQKMSFIPDTKLVITNALSSMTEKAEMPPETLQLYFLRRIGLSTMLDLLKKRWQALDLISVMQELKRTLLLKKFSREQEETTELWDCNTHAVEIQENLSFLPRLKQAK